MKKSFRESSDSRSNQSWAHDDEKTLYTSSHSHSHSRSISNDGLSGGKKTYEPQTMAFDEHSLPTTTQLLNAGGLSVLSESGVLVRFDSLWKKQKTIVIFIRHFMCPSCQDYMKSIKRNISSDLLRRAGVSLVIISNGDYKLIKYYRRIFSTPFPVYTDPRLEVYHALGMTRQIEEVGPRSEYVRHGRVAGRCMVVANALKVCMPLWKYGGRSGQLGGEFVLGPGFQCDFSHRMRYKRSHLPILKVVKEAGVFGRKDYGYGPGGTLSQDEGSWMRDRKRNLAAIRERKKRRRGGTEWCESESAASSDSGDAASFSSDRWKGRVKRMVKRSKEAF